MSTLRGADAATFFMGLVVVVCLQWAFTRVDDWGAQHDAQANVLKDDSEMAAPDIVGIIAFVLSVGCWSWINRDHDQAKSCRENWKRRPKTVNNFREARQDVERPQIVHPAKERQGAAEMRALKKLENELWQCFKERSFEEGLVSYDSVRNSIGEGSTQVWSMLSYCALQAKDLRRCEEFIQRLLAVGGLSGHDFLNIVRFHVQIVDAEGLARSLSAMRRMGFQLDTIYRNKALGLCAEVRDVRLAEALMEGTSSVSWDACSYNILIRLYGNCRQLSRCEELVAEMRTAGLKLTDVTYGSLIDAHVKSGDVDGATEVLQKLTDSGFEPNGVHYTTLIQGLACSGRLDDAERLLDDMETCGATLDVFAYATILSVYSKQRAHEPALRLLQRMKHLGIEPGSQSFHMALSACNNAVIRPKEILHVFFSLIDLGMRPDTATFSLAVKALVRAGGFAEALELVRDPPSRFASELRPRVFRQLASACQKAGRRWEAGQASDLARAHLDSAAFPGGADQGEIFTPAAFRWREGLPETSARAQCCPTIPQHRAT